MPFTLVFSTFAGATRSRFTQSVCAAGEPDERINVQLRIEDDLNFWLFGDTNRCAGKPGIYHRVCRPALKTAAAKRNGFSIQTSMWRKKR